MLNPYNIKNNFIILPALEMLIVNVVQQIKCPHQRMLKYFKGTGDFKAFTFYKY